MKRNVFLIVKKMKKLIIILLFFICNIATAQDKVFPRNDTKPMQSRYENGSIEVSKSMYGLRFKKDIPEQYKNAVKTFFKDNLNNVYKPMKTYKLKVAKKYDYIFIENKKTIKHS